MLEENMKHHSKGLCALKTFGLLVPNMETCPSCKDKVIETTLVDYNTLMLCQKCFDQRVTKARMTHTQKLFM